MLKEREPQPVAVMFFVLGIALGIALFFSSIYFAPTIRHVLVADGITASNGGIEMTQLYRETLPSNSDRL